MRTQNVSLIKNVSFSAKTKPQSIKENTKTQENNNKKLKVALYGLAVVGAVIAGRAVYKNYTKHQNEFKEDILRNLQKTTDRLIQNTNETIENMSNSTTQPKHFKPEHVAEGLAGAALVTAAATELKNEAQKAKPENNISSLVILKSIPFEENEGTLFDDDIDEDDPDFDLIKYAEKRSDERETVKDKDGKILATKRTKERYSGTYQGRDVIIDFKSILPERKGLDFSPYFYVIRDAETGELIKMLPVNSDGSQRPLTLGHSKTHITRAKKSYTNSENEKIEVVTKNGILHSHTIIREFDDGSKEIVVDYEKGHPLGYKNKKIITIAPDGTREETSVVGSSNSSQGFRW